MNDIAQFQRYFELATNVGNWADMSKTQEAELRDLAENHLYTNAGVRAMAALNFYFDAQYAIGPAFSDQHFTKRQNTRSDVGRDDMLNIYPNPANNVVNISLHYPGSIENNLTLQIFDATNRFVAAIPVSKSNEFITLNTTDWQSGLYIYQINWPSGEVSSGKFDVIH